MVSTWYMHTIPVAFEANPHHRRAQLVVLTDEGRHTFDALMRLQARGSIASPRGAVKEIATVHRVMMLLRKKLEDFDKPRERN